MDLPDLLEPERILCRCDIHSKKRALQTVAELLGASLRRAAAPDGASSGPDGPSTGNAPNGGPNGGSGDGTSADVPAGTAPEDGATATDGGAPDAIGPEPDEPPTRVANLELGAKRERGARGGSRKLGSRGGSKGGAKQAAEAESEDGDISDMDILDALIGRERLGSTGLGHGVALPHSRLDVVDTPLAAMITLNEGVDFEAGDGEPVDLVLGLLVPRDCNDEHLKILANLARRFNDAGFREALREHESGDELFEHLQRLASPS